MTEQRRNIYVPAPVDMDVIGRTIEESIFAIERSYALLSRLDADLDNRYSLETVSSSIRSIDISPSAETPVIWGLLRHHYGHVMRKIRKS
jgi:hypothetical protein